VCVSAYMCVRVLMLVYINTLLNGRSCGK